MDGRPFPSGNTPSTVFVVAAQDDPSPETACWHNLVSWGVNEIGQGRVLYKGCHTSLAFAETFGTWQDQHPTQTWPTGRAAVLSAVFDSAGVSLRLNGADSYRWDAPASQRMKTVAAESALLGGATWEPAAGWVGRIGEVVVFDRVLTLAELQTVEKYLATRWQVVIDQR